MVRHPKVIEWEAKLKAVFDEIDHELEGRFGDRYPLHPARAAHGETANPEDSGLFNLGAAFTGGFGSKFGKGYVVEARISTLASIPAELRAKLEDEVARLLREKLPLAFPGQDLKIERDATGYKIHGDLSLGSV